MNWFWQSHQSWPLQRKLAIYVALAFLLCAAITAPFMAASQRAQIQREVLEAKAADARYIASVMDREIALRQRALNSLSVAVGALLKERQLGELNRFLADHEVAQSLFSRDIYVLAADGQRVAEVPPRGTLGSSYQDSAYFQQAMASAKPVVMPLIGRFAKAPVVIFAEPLLDADGSVLGLLCGSELVGTGTPFDFSLKEKPGSSLVYHLISRTDNLYVSSTERALVMTALAPKGLHPLLDRRRDGWMEPTTDLSIHGHEVLSAAANLASVNWYVVALVSTEEAFGMVKQSVLQVASAVGLVALALALFLWLLLRREFAPLARAAAQLNAVSHGSRLWSDLPISGTGEVRVLLQSLNQLHHHLGEQNTQLAQERDRLQSTLRAGEKLNAELAQSENRYRSLVVSATQCVWRLQPGASGVDADSARWWCAFSGQTEEQRSADGGEGWLAVVHAEDRGRLSAWWHSLRTSAPADTIQCRARRADGAWRWLSMRGVALAAAAGEAPEWVGTIADITEQKQAEDALISSKVTLEAALLDRTQAEEAKRRAEDATLAKSNFLANMSHEIRTPMNGILGLAYLLEKNTLSEDSRLLVQKIRATGGNLLGVINDILDFSKIEAGHLQIHEAPFELEELLDHLATLMGAYADNKVLVLAIAPPSQVLGALLGDRLRLLQVLVNLSSNAIKFTPKGFVEVAVDLVSEDAHSVLLRFRVRDSGIGVPLSMQRHIFHPFEQADMSTTREFGGTGLGLSISSRLVELMGGSLQLSSTVDHGSSFFFTLVLGKSAAAAPPALPPLRYLVAHHSAVARQALQRTVQSLGGVAETLETANAVPARLRSAASHGQPFDVLVLDGQPGPQAALPLLGTLDAAPALAPRPVTLVLTDQAGHAPGALAHLAHIDAALSLPVSAVALRTAVRSSLQRRAGIALNPLAPAACRLAGLRLLVVDDSDINLEVAKRILEGEGARVDCASDGAQALIWLQLHAGDVDLVLMDVQMPAMDGYQTTRKIRALPALATVPVVALTAGVSEAHRDEALAAGMSDFVTKPFDVEQMVALILALTQRHAAPLETPMHDPQAARQPELSERPPAMDIERAIGIWKDGEVYRKFLRKFARDYRHCVSEMRQGELAAAKARAHKLRGAAGSLVLQGIVQATQALEHSLATGFQPDAAYAHLQQAFDLALLQIQAYAGADPDTPQDSAAPVPADPARLQALLQQALLQLEEDSPSAVEPVLAELMDLLGAADLLPLRSALESYQFEACKQAVRLLAARHHISLET